MNAALYTPGPGDESTWSPCLGHGLDPRTPDAGDDTDRATAIADAIRTLREAERLIDRMKAEDEKLFLRIDALMADAADFLIGEMDRARAREIERLTAEVAELRAAQRAADRVAA